MPTTYEHPLMSNLLLCSENENRESAILTPSPTQPQEIHGALHRRFMRVAQARQAAVNRQDPAVKERLDTEYRALSEQRQKARLERVASFNRPAQ